MTERGWETGGVGLMTEAGKDEMWKGLQRRSPLRSTLLSHAMSVDHCACRLYEMWIAGIFLSIVHAVL
jgi:hypothetical protein